MMRVTIELLPGGLDCGPGENEVLGVIEISNDILRSMESAGYRGDYSFLVRKKRGRAFKRVKVRDYPRKAYHPWELVRRGLNLVADQNGGHL